MSLPVKLAAVVREQAAGRCQYCCMHEGLQGATFHIEHVLPKSQGGADELSNLTLACPKISTGEILTLIVKKCVFKAATVPEGRPALSAAG